MLVARSARSSLASSELCDSAARTRSSVLAERAYATSQAIRPPTAAPTSVHIRFVIKDPWFLLHRRDRLRDRDHTLLFRRTDRCIRAPPAPKSGLWLELAFAYSFRCFLDRPFAISQVFRVAFHFNDRVVLQ